MWVTLADDHAHAGSFLYENVLTAYTREFHDAALRPLVDAGWVTVFDISRSDVEPVADTPEEAWRRIDEVLSTPREEWDLDVWIGLTEAGRVEALRAIRCEDQQVDVLEAGIDQPPVAYATIETWVEECEGVEVDEVLVPLLERGWLDAWRGEERVGTGPDAVGALEGDRAGLGFVTTEEGAEWFRVNVTDVQ
jgi:hypothetical protein